ncbi:reverse transcriptase domain, reverse transcriptase zinc-binding domain protein [Tanacetum coccineum]
MNSKEVIWILFGDFNVVRTREERSGSNFVERDARSFNKFIANKGLEDLAIGGRRFTRFNSTVTKLRWDTKAEEGCLTSTDRLKREEYLMDLNFLEQKERDSLKQKSQLDGDDVTLLESNFTMDEIKTAEWDCCSFKSPGPDGFNFKFIKRQGDPLSPFPNQTAFLKGRQILDGCLIANEIINFAKNEKINMLLFKVDFEKAFDSVN